MFYKIPIKALSVNKLFQGRRFRTKEYDQYEEELSYLLPRTLKVDPLAPLELNIVFGFSNKLQDIDGPIKAFLDVLQKMYMFNDRNVVRLVVEKEIVAKGKEFIGFEISTVSTCVTP